MKSLSEIKCVIKRVGIEASTPWPADSQRDWSEIYGPGHRVSVRSRTEYYYKHKETGAEYLYLMGGFAPPGNTLPGFAVVLGLDRNEDPTTRRRIIRVLAEAEAPSLRTLIWECLILKKKYGTHPVLCHGWAADVDRVTYQRIAEIVREISQKQIEEQHFHALPGTYSHYETSCFRDYLTVLAEHQKTLDRGNCERLRGYMDKVHSLDRSRLKPEDNPATAALAYAVTELMVHKRWEMDVDVGPTPHEEDDFWEALDL